MSCRRGGQRMHGDTGGRGRTVFVVPSESPEGAAGPSLYPDSEPRPREVRLALPLPACLTSLACSETFWGVLWHPLTGGKPTEG